MSGSTLPMVVVVDDDELIRGMIQRLCATVGIDAQCFASVEAMQSAIDSETPGVLLLDLRLPGLSGVPAIERCADRFPRMNVISMSAHADARTVMRALRAGAIDFFDKPFAKQELLEAIQTALSHPVDGRPRPETGEVSVNQVAALVTSLTRQQLAVVELLASGVAEDDLPEALELHPRSTRRHKQNALAKLGLESVDVSLLQAALQKFKAARR